MIDYYCTEKRIWVRIIAAILVMTFLWYDISWAGDFFYARLTPYSGAVNVIPKEGANYKNFKDIVKEESKKLETNVTNYDELYYNQKKSGVEGLLPSVNEKETDNKF